MNIDQLREQFLSDFGVAAHGTRIDVHDTRPISIGKQNWVFTLRSAEGPEDVTWTTLNSKMYFGDDAESQVATNISMARATMSLAVCAVNGVPVFQLVGVEIPPEEMAKIHDVNNPPDRIKYGAAKLFQSWMDKVRDYNVLEFLRVEYERLFLGDHIQFPGAIPQEQPTIFECVACSFHLPLIGEQLVRLGGSVEERGGIICPSCGEIAKVQEAKGSDPL